MGKNTVRLISRDPMVDLARTTVEVRDEGVPGRCTVVIRRGSDTETFRRVPRAVEQFARALNGGPAEPPVAVGELESLSGSTLQLAEPAAVRVPANSCVTVGETAFLVDGAARKGAKSLTLVKGETGTVTVGDAVHLVPYHSNWSTASRAGASLAGGSQTVQVEVGAATGEVPNGKASDLLAGRGCCWRGETPGRAFDFDGSKRQRLSLPAERLGQAGTTGDLTLEAWVLPAAVTARSRLLYAKTDQAQYTLGLAPAPLPSALAFDGTNDGVDLGPLDLASTDFTIEFWAKRNSTGRDDFLVTHGSVTPVADKALHIGFRSTNVFTMAFWADDNDTPTAYTDLDWHHWAAVYTRATRERIIYRDGLEVRRSTAAAAYAGVGNLRLGVSPAHGSRANARLDEVRVWGRVRSAEELLLDRDRRLTGREAGLLSYWSFTGRSVADLSGNGRDGTVAGNPAVAASPLNGHRVFAGLGGRLVRSQDVFASREWSHLAAAMQQSGAVRLDGRSYLDTGSDQGLDLTGDLTIEAFTMLDRLGQPHGLVSYGALADGTGRRVPYQLSVQTDGKLAFCFEDPTGRPCRYTSTAALAAATFHRVAVTRKAGSGAGKQWFDIAFYLDGVAAGTSRYEGAGPNGGSGPLEFGRVRDGSVVAALHGVLAEVRLWRTARDGNQVCGPVGPRDQGLVGHWRMEENAGNVAGDTTDSYPARLRGATWTKNPDPNGSPIWLYRNGVLVPTTSVIDADGIRTPYGDALDLTGGIGYTSTKTKKKESKRTFKIDVACTPSGDLVRYSSGSRSWTRPAVRRNCPARSTPTGSSPSTSTPARRTTRTSSPRSSTRAGSTRARTRTPPPCGRPANQARNRHAGASCTG